MLSDYRPDALLAEVVGTFVLVFAATGSIMVDDMAGGVVMHVGVAAAPGLVVAAMIYAVGDVSVAHFNPVVTIGSGASAACRPVWSCPASPVRSSARCWPASPCGCCCRSTAA